MNQDERLPTIEDLQQAMREVCLQQAEALHQRIGEAVECLRDGNHLGALGALEGVDKRMLELSTALKVIQNLLYRKKR